MENKGFKGLIWLIILLFILLFFVIWLVIYKGFFVEGNSLNLNNDSTTTKSIKTTTEKIETLSNDELENYLSYVPFSLLYEDAYTEKNIDNINLSALMYTIFTNTQKEMLLNFEECNYEGCVEENLLNQQFEDAYNIKINNFADEFINDYLGLKNGYYYVKALGVGGEKYKSKASKISYEINNNELLIKEQVAIILESGGNISIYNGKNVIKSFTWGGINSDENYSPEIEAENYVKENLNNFNIYNHKFKQRDDGTYYWYSTEIIEVN